MKIKLLSLLSALAFIAPASGATLFYDYVGGSNGGMKQSDGTTTIAAGTTIRFGTFSSAPVNTLTQAQLEAAFHPVFSTVTADGSGTWNTTGTFLTNGTHNGLPYDINQTVDNPALTGDIAGTDVYMWVMNSATSAAATQQGVFSFAGTGAFVWADANALPNADAFFSASFTSGDGMIAHIGALNAGGGTTAHALANVSAVPEPSRAVLALAGLGGLLFRRRRA